MAVNPFRIQEDVRVLSVPEAMAHRHGTDIDIDHWSIELEAKEDRADLERGMVVFSIADKYYYTG